MPHELPRQVKPECCKCAFGVIDEGWGIGELVTCKRYPTETTHNPDDWCGEFEKGKGK